MFFESKGNNLCNLFNLLTSRNHAENGNLKPLMPFFTVEESVVVFAMLCYGIEFYPPPPSRHTHNEYDDG